MAGFGLGIVSPGDVGVSGSSVAGITDCCPVGGTEDGVIVGERVVCTCIIVSVGDKPGVDRPTYQASEAIINTVINPRPITARQASLRRESGRRCLMGRVA